MADSEDEYDKKIRDKFRGERTESYRGFDARRDERRPREDWNERDAWSARSRGGRADYRAPGREKYSPVRHDIAPAAKRMRSDWEDRRYFDTSNSTNYSYGTWLSAETQAPTSARTTGATSSATNADTSGETQPPMMTLKSFLNTLDDTISDDEALKKYNEYKLEFRKQQLNEFFIAHKDEEWFKEKYHPVFSGQRKEQHLNFLKKRLEVFLELFNKGKIDEVMVDTDQSDKLTKLMDSFVIQLEGGTENDLAVLEDKPPVNIASNVSSTNKSSQNNAVTKEKEAAAHPSEKDSEINDQTVTTTQEDEKDEKGKEENEQKSKDSEKENGEAAAVETIEIKDDEPEENIKPSIKNKPKELHRTTSVFLRNLAPVITREDIENVCRKYKGFLRIALADPQHDRRWFRRGWITFERDVDIKEICWNLSNIRVKDNELSPIVNRDLSRRVRTVSSITSNKHIVRNDMKHCVQIIRNLDKKYNLWPEVPSEEDPNCLKSKNPVLQNITSYLIEEASAEEEALLGEKENIEEVDERDPEVFKVLDRMLLYLRLVHSVDYYNHCEYPNEDEMPNRCGIIHARITTENNKVTPEEVTEYSKAFKAKLHHLLEQPPSMSEEELISLGLKTSETEVKKFITANTQELAPEKWLCPLSGKKFKGPEFVRKHIMNKYADRIEEVKLEVEYYNNYLRDPKRPQLPEHPGNKMTPKSDPASGATNTPNTSVGIIGQTPPTPYQFGYSSGLYTANYGRGMGYGGYSRPTRPFGGRGGGRGSGDFRQMLNYRDLDAPVDPEDRH